MSALGPHYARMVSVALVLAACTVNTSCADSGTGPAVVREDLEYFWPARGDLTGDRQFVAAAAERLDAAEPHLLWAGRDIGSRTAGRSVAIFVVESQSDELAYGELVQAVTRDGDGHWSTSVVEPFGQYAAVRIPVGVPKGWHDSSSATQFFLLRHEVDRVHPVTGAAGGRCSIIDDVAGCPDGLLVFGNDGDDEYRHPALDVPLSRWSGTANQLRSLVEAVQYGGDQPAGVAATDTRGQLLLGRDQHLYSFTLSLGNRNLGQFRMPDGRTGAVVLIRTVAVTDDGTIESGTWTIAWVPDDGSSAVFGENATDTDAEQGKGIAVAIPLALGHPLVVATSGRDLTLRTQPSLPILGDEIIAEQGPVRSDGYRITVFAGTVPVTVEHVDGTGKVVSTKQVSPNR